MRLSARMLMAITGLGLVSAAASAGGAQPALEQGLWTITVTSTTNGKADWAFPISLNRSLMEDKWDLIINVGHVVPHEVLGFANHNKNYFIGLGGKDLICAAHLAAASCGMVPRT